MKMIHKILASIVLLAAVLSQAASQSVNVRSTSGSKGFLLTRKDVRDDLGLSADLRRKLDETHDKIMKAHGVEMNEMGNGRMSMKGNVPAAMDEFEATAMKMLTPPQKTRLGEISLQVSSFAAILQSDVAKSLKMTDAQSKKAKQLQMDMITKQSEMVRGAGGKFDSEMMEKFRDLQQELLKDLEGVLTSDQKAQFKKMQGKPFKGAKTQGR